MSHGRVEACERALLGMYCHVPLLRGYIREMMQQAVVGEPRPAPEHEIGPDNADNSALISDPAHGSAQSSSTGTGSGTGTDSGTGSRLTVVNSYEWMGMGHQTLWEMFSHLDHQYLTSTSTSTDSNSSTTSSTSSSASTSQSVGVGIGVECDFWTPTHARALVTSLPPPLGTPPPPHTHFPYHFPYHHYHFYPLLCICIHTSYLILLFICLCCMYFEVVLFISLLLSYSLLTVSYVTFFFIIAPCLFSSPSPRRVCGAGGYSTLPPQPATTSTTTSTHIRTITSTITSALTSS